MKLSVPPVSALHCEPSHRAMFRATDVPAVLKEPTAKRLAPRVSSAYPERPSGKPFPNVCQDTPFHRAMRFAFVLPAVVNIPVAINSLVGVNTFTAYTG